MWHANVIFNLILAFRGFHIMKFSLPRSISKRTEAVGDIL